MGGRQQLPRDERPKTRLLCERDRLIVTIASARVANTVHHRQRGTDGLHDSPLEGDGIRGSFSVPGPLVRIHLPPAVSLRTIGPSAKGASFGTAIPAFIPFEVPGSGYHSHAAFARP